MGWRLGLLRVLLPLVFSLVFPLMFSPPAFAGTMPSAPSVPLRIGVLAWQGAEESEVQWGVEFRRLAARLPGYTLVLSHHDLAGMEQALNAGQLDFVVTNPGHYVMLEGSAGISRIATQTADSLHDPAHVVGSAVVVRADRDDLQTLGDLQGRTLAAVSPEAFGGYQLIWAELKELGLNPEQGAVTPRFTGFPMGRVLNAVARGEADGGVLRACLLEQLERQGTVAPGTYRVLSPRLGSAPCRVTTRLYPGWAFAAASQTPAPLSREVLFALLSLPPDSAGMAWSVPADYRPVHELLRQLQIGPYAFLREPSWQSLAHRYWPWGAGLLALLLCWLAYTLRVEHLVQRRTRELQVALAEGQRLTERVATSQAQMDHLSRLSMLGELAGTLAHELNQPLATIANYGRSLLRRQARQQLSAEALSQAAEEIASEAERAADILRGIRAFAAKRARVREVHALVALVGNATDLLRGIQGRAPAVQVANALGDDPGLVWVDPLQIQQVLLNLLKNAWDAQAEADRHDPLEVRLETLAGSPGQGYRVAVRDHGVGLAPGNEDRLFEAFFTTKAEGLGLGLSISKTLIEAHGGELFAQVPADGVGLLCGFTLPPANSGP